MQVQNQQSQIVAVQVGTPHRLAAQLALEDLHPAEALQLAAVKPVAPLQVVPLQVAPLLVALLREVKRAVPVDNLAADQAA